MAPRALSLPAVLLALATCLAMAVVGTGIWLTLAVLLVWLGSLWLIGAQPPPPRQKEDNGALTRDTMRELIEHSGIPLLLTEGDRVAIANASARRVLGEHIVGQDVRVAFRHPEAIKLLSKEKPGSTIVHGLTRRRDIWRISRKPMGGGMAVLELINRNAEADISRAHTDFVANASHELRTPLASIIGYVETLLEGGDGVDKDTSRRFLSTILREAQRLQGLVSDLLSLSRVEAEKHEQPRARIELAGLVERAARDAAGPGRLDRLDLDLELAITVRGDEQQLEQLVRNLVDNALKYGAADQPISVALEAVESGEAQLTVADRGEGIAPEHLPHLTRRFYRTDPSRSRASGGTGLGLAIVKHIVERHRGRLDIASRLGQGTTITVRMPTLADEESTLS